VHRIGRTARAGADGDAISFACEDFAVSLPEIEDYIGHKIPSAPIGAELLATSVTAAPPGEYGYRPRPPRSGGHSGPGPGRRPPGRRGAPTSKGARGRGR
jgi:ATP-dependent RNA helicase RhlB